MPLGFTADENGKKRIAQLMVDHHVLIFGKIIPAMNIAPCYPEVRWLMSDPAAMRIIVEEMAKVVRKLDIDLLAGCEFAGVPLATALSLETGLPVVHIRKKPKAYGSQTAVVGKITGSCALLIDDATGKGEGKNQFAEYLETESGGRVRVTDMLVLYHTGHPLIPWYDEHNVTHHQLIYFEDFAHHARDVGYLSPRLHDLMWDCYRDYNVQCIAHDKERFERILKIAEEDGWPIFNRETSYEDLVEQSKQLGKWDPLPESKTSGLH